MSEPTTRYELVFRAVVLNASGELAEKNSDGSRAERCVCVLLLGGAERNSRRSRGEALQQNTGPGGGAEGRCSWRRSRGEEFLEEEQRGGVTQNTGARGGAEGRSS